MTKQEILDAINATIVTNGQKGITAESLANILTEIVNAAGEGSSGVGGEYIDMTMANPEDLESDELTPEAKAHNAEVYAKLVQALRNNTGTPYISVPTGEGYNMSINSVMLEESTTNIVMTLNMTADGQFTNVMFSVNDVLSGGETAIAIGSNVVLMVLLLKEDGQIMITIPSL